MMNRLKKSLSAIIAIMLILSMLLPSIAFATSDINNNEVDYVTIIIDNASGKGYTAYRLLNLETDGQGHYKYSFNDTYKSIIMNIIHETNKDIIEDDAIAYLEHLEDTREFADRIYMEISKANIIGELQSSDGVFPPTEQGWYLVAETGELETGADRTLVMLDTVGQDVLHVTEKRGVPELEKYVVENGNDVKYTSAGLGEKVTFKIVGTMPENIEDYETYKYIVHDTLPEGLTFDKIDFISINGVNLPNPNDYVYVGNISNNTPIENSIPTMNEIQNEINDAMQMESNTMANESNAIENDTSDFDDSEITYKEVTIPSTQLTFKGLENDLADIPDTFEFHYKVTNEKYPGWSDSGILRTTDSNCEPAYNGGNGYKWTNIIIKIPSDADENNIITYTAKNIGVKGYVCGFYSGGYNNSLIEAQKVPYTNTGNDPSPLSVVHEWDKSHNHSLFIAYAIPQVAVHTYYNRLENGVPVDEEGTKIVTDKAQYTNTAAWSSVKTKEWATYNGKTYVRVEKPADDVKVTLATMPLQHKYVQATKVKWVNGYDNGIIKETTIPTGGDYTDYYPETPTRENYKFISWSKPEVSADGTIIIVAKWTSSINNHCSVEFKFDDIKPLGVNANTEVVIQYTAIVNNNALIGNDGNINEAYLEFSNDPYDEGSSTNTPKDTAKVFSFAIVTNKVDNENKALPGASFHIEKWDGSNYVAMTTSNVESRIEDNGTKFIFETLNVGKYKLVEDSAPTGYNKADDIVFEVKATYGKDETTQEDIITNLYAIDESGTTLSVFSVSQGYGTLSTNMVNTTGIRLPSTGSTGAIIIYCLAGIALVISITSFIIARKKKK